MNIFQIRTSVGQLLYKFLCKNKINLWQPKSQVVRVKMLQLFTRSILSICFPSSLLQSKSKRFILTGFSQNYSVRWILFSFWQKLDSIQKQTKQRLASLIYTVVRAKFFVLIYDKQIIHVITYPGGLFYHSSSQMHSTN